MNSEASATSRQPHPSSVYPSFLHLHSVLDFEIKREDDRIHRVFQDPSGQHLLVCMSSKECYYLGRGGKRSVPFPNVHVPVTYLCYYVNY